MNETLQLIARRCSTRVFADGDLSPSERDAIVEAAFRAPTAGNMMLYSIVDVRDPETKGRLAHLCDEQPFIAAAPFVLVFVADYQRWMDLFEHADVARLQLDEHRLWSGPGDLMLSCCDALIAAQNAVVAAESLGIGSCYIGDILENGEEVAALLDLPRYTMPVTMLVFGRPATHMEPRPRCSEHVLHVDRYRRLDEAQLEAESAALERVFAPHGLKPGISTYPQAVYERKHASAFMREMNRSVLWWLERWGLDG